MNRKITIRASSPSALQRKLNNEIRKAQREAANEIQRKLRKAFR